MNWVLAGLGNPGEEYEGSRHNVGRELLLQIEKKEGEGKSLFGKRVVILYPDVYMNNSGSAIKKAVPSKKAAEQLIVVHDDLDIPLGSIKISFGSGAGGHNGIKSVEKALKTQDYVRIRVGISPSSPSGKVKRPAPEKIADFVLAKFRPPEKEKLKKSKKLIAEALELILAEGVERAQTEINSK